MEIVTLMGGSPVGRRGLVRWGDECSVNEERLLSNLFKKILTEEAGTTEAGSLFQYFTTLAEKADPLLR